jgi:hypothetical protein
MRFAGTHMSLFFLGAVLVSQAHASPMLEPTRHKLTIEFNNGDVLSVACKNNTRECRLKLHVNRKSFTYGSPELNGLSLLPEHAFLYSGPGSGREKYFSFEVSVLCPEDQEGKPPSDCYANGAVRDGKLLDFILVHRSTKDVREAS